MSAVMKYREKFITRSIILRGEQQRQTVLSLVSNLPLDASHPLEIIVREEVRKRGLDANGYYWMRLGEIAEQGWFNGRKYISDVWHEYAKRHLMPDTVTTKNGEVVSKWIESDHHFNDAIRAQMLRRIHNDC